MAVHGTQALVRPSPRVFRRRRTAPVLTLVSPFRRIPHLAQANRCLPASGRFYNRSPRTGGESMETERKLLLRPSEVADLIGVSRSQVYALIAAHVFPVVRL